eukprot:PhM_4_TR8752/c3_g4_i1/m.93488
MTVSPSLCQPLAVTPSNDITTTTNNANSLVLSGTTTVANYWTVMQTIQLASCAHTYPTLDTYDIMWQLVPDSPTYLMPPYYEPHYYWSSQNAGAGTATSWDGAVADCRTRSVLGLPGYLATITSDAERQA